MSWLPAWASPSLLETAPILSVFGLSSEAEATEAPSAISPSVASPSLNAPNSMSPSEALRSPQSDDPSTQSGDVGEISTTQRDRPLAKKAVKRPLQHWEEVSESDVEDEASSENDEGEEQSEVPRGGFNPFLRRDRSKKPDLRESPDRQYAADLADMPATLKSYEEQVLALKPPRALPAPGTSSTPNKASTSEAVPDAEAMGLSESDRMERMLNSLMQEKILEEERELIDLNIVAERMTDDKSMRASHVITRFAKLKLKMMEQKMKLFTQSEDQGNDQNMRAKKLLTWVALLSVFQKFNTKMDEPDIREAKTVKVLSCLPAPPPPPPPDDPPDADEEELHRRYAAMRTQNEPLWKEAGRRQLGKEKFNAMQNMQEGPAEKQKERVAAQCLARAEHVMSEKEYKDYVQKCWRLRDNYTPMNEYNGKDFEKHVAEPHSSSTSRSRKP